MRWMVRGDIDGFFGLALDNLVQLLLIDTLCRLVLGFPPDLVYGRVLPGEFLEHTTPGESYGLSYLMVTYVFLGDRPAAPPQGVTR